MGVWIEIFQASQSAQNATVTPCVGVWIEIKEALLPLEFEGVSLPGWGCGLKYAGAWEQDHPDKSLPAWGCGLKSLIWIDDVSVSPVTPCVGVWIEINWNSS